MGSMTTWGRSALANSFFRPEASPAVGSLWVALTTSTPVVTDSGASLIEPIASSYERTPYGIGAYYWTMTGPGQLINAHNVDWRVPEDDWGQVTGWALCTESMSGMAVGCGPLLRTMTITAGTRLRIPPGGIRLSFL